MKGIDSTMAAPYGAKAADIAAKLSVLFPATHGEDPCTDNGYVMRLYGGGMGILYDWAYDALTPGPAHANLYDRELLAEYLGNQFLFELRIRANSESSVCQFLCSPTAAARDSPLGVGTWQSATSRHSLRST